MMYNYYGSMLSWMGGWGIFMFLAWIVWTFVGILLIVLLLKKIRGK